MGGLLLPARGKLRESDAKEVVASARAGAALAQTMRAALLQASAPVGDGRGRGIEEAAEDRAADLERVGARLSTWMLGKIQVHPTSRKTPGGAPGGSPVSYSGSQQGLAGEAELGLRLVGLCRMRRLSV